jgi:hypothetical protein
MGGERYELERALIGDLDVLDNSSTVARLPAGREASGSDVLAFLESVRAEAPDEPLWRGVRRLTAADRHVEVEFHEPVAPRLLPESNVKVECHLYDDDALREAERRRSVSASKAQKGGSPRRPSDTVA